MEKHEVDMVLAILEMFKNTARANEESHNQAIMMMMGHVLNSKDREKEKTNKARFGIPEVDT